MYWMTYSMYYPGVLLCIIFMFLSLGVLFRIRLVWDIFHFAPSVVAGYSSGDSALNMQLAVLRYELKMLKAHSKTWSETLLASSALSQHILQK